MYHEKQQGNYCMKHAINNLIGKELCSNKELDIFKSENTAILLKSNLSN